MYFNKFISLLGRIARVNSVKINNNFIKVTMVFIREYHFSRLVKKLLRIYVWLKTDPQSAHLWMACISSPGV